MAGEFKMVADGKFCEIWMSPKALKVFRKGAAEDRSRMGTIFGNLSEKGTYGMNDTQFKSEGRFLNAEGKMEMVYAVKAYQLRVYGCWRGTDPKRLICPEVAIKKTKKADRALLARAAKNVGDF